MPAHRFKSSDGPILLILLACVADVLLLASKMYAVKGKTWWASIGALTHSYMHSMTEHIICGPEAF